MALDGMFLRFVAEEINSAAAGLRVEKIHQPSPEELVLVLRGRGTVQRLLLSAHSNAPKIHFTKSVPENPAKPPMLCMLFRKRLTAALLRGVRQQELDRVLYLDFDATNEIGDPEPLTLCIEIMAQHSNIILFESGSGKIVDAVKRVDPSMSSVRCIIPGMPYSPPPRHDKLNLLECEPQQAACAVREAIAASGKTPSDAILSVLQGASPLTCRETAARAFAEDIFGGEKTDRLDVVLTELAERLKSGRAEPCVLKDKNGEAIEFSFMPILQYGTDYENSPCTSCCELLDGYYADKDAAQRAKRYADDLYKTVAAATRRIAKKLDLRRAELERCEDREKLRVMAELIAANLYRLEKGSLFYDLENYYDENKILRIPADPALSPQGNSQKYYKEYRKAKNAVGHLTQLIEQNEAELQYIETVADALSRAQTSAEFGEIRAELSDGGYIRLRQQKNAKRPKPLPPIEYTSPEGYRIFVGRNNVQNELLSLKTAKGGDMWLHTQKIPGSHVIVESRGEPFPDSVILYAAVIAARHSKAAQSSAVAVDYTLAKNLKKPVGGKPGMVIYHVYNTLIVNPNE